MMKVVAILLVHRITSIELMRMMDQTTIFVFILLIKNQTRIATYAILMRYENPTRQTDNFFIAE